MLKNFTSRIRVITNTWIEILSQFKNQYAFELKDATICSLTSKHIIEIKVIGKGQSISCLAENVVADDNFLIGFSPCDIRTIVCLAMTDKYEAILQQEKIKKSHELIRSQSKRGEKTIVIRNKLTGHSSIESISNLANGDIINDLESQDAYYLGYLAGQEQIFRNFAHLKMTSSKNTDEVS